MQINVSRTSHLGVDREMSYSISYILYFVSVQEGIEGKCKLIVFSNVNSKNKFLQITGWKVVI